jgi:hypothetical protein
MRTLGSSIGIFLETCIIPRMITKLVLRNHVNIRGEKMGGVGVILHLGTEAGHLEGIVWVLGFLEVELYSIWGCSRN